MGVDRAMDLYKVYNQVRSDAPQDDESTAATLSSASRMPDLYWYKQNRASQQDDIHSFFQNFFKANEYGRSSQFPWSNGDDHEEQSSEDSIDFSRTATGLFRNQTLASSATHSVVTLADQFTWGAVVCAAVFIVVFVCVMTAWWVHKKQQDFSRGIERRDSEDVDTRRGSTLAPFCIDNSVRTISNGRLHRSESVIQCPPSYYDVIGFFDPPPSYNEVLTRVNVNGSQAYDNHITIDELPPPFAESDCKSVTPVQEPSANPPITLCAVIVLPPGDERNSSTMA